MNNKDIDAQFLCKDCTRYNLCEYYHRRRKDSYICKYFHLSVTPQEPKTGHWIANAPQYDMFNPQYICSECGNAHIRTTPYCEMCGAKMVESQESEDKE